MGVHAPPHRCSQNSAILTPLHPISPPVQLAGWDFTSMFVSPLKRAVQTSEIVWGGRKAPVVQLPSLREIDLYSFQVSREGRAVGS